MFAGKVFTGGAVVPRPVNARNQCQELSARAPYL
jgi:hypothetical protein